MRGLQTLLESAILSRASTSSRFRISAAARRIRAAFSSCSESWDFLKAGEVDVFRGPRDISGVWPFSSTAFRFPGVTFEQPSIASEIPAIDGEAELELIDSLWQTLSSVTLSSLAKFKRTRGTPTLQIHCRLIFG
jgi:hypothetical protein